MTRRPPKTISVSAIIGQRGVALIETIVLRMGSLWHPSGTLEGGIDGHIELRDPTSGKLLGSWIAVQSKATERPFPADSGDSFSWPCDERDLDYWLQGNLPVVLVVSRPSTEEAYWVSIKTYFSSPAARKTRTVRFDKHRNRLSEGSLAELTSIGVSKSAGTYLAPSPRNETLYSNLLEVVSFSPSVWVADTDYTDPKALWNELSALGGNSGGEWILKASKLISFHDLTQFPWDRVCERGTAEPFSTQDWAQSQELEGRDDLIRLLGQALECKLRPDIRYSRKKECYYFRSTLDLAPRAIRYRSLVQATGRVVFRGYPRHDDPTRMSYYRHSAFEGRFRRLEDSWYLQINPTYFFTWDGDRLDRYYSEHLTKMRRIERNQAVLGQVRMWAEYLSRQPDLFTPAYPFLQFGNLVAVSLPWGVDDKLWLAQEASGSDVEELTVAPEAELL